MYLLHNQHSTISYGIADWKTLETVVYLNHRKDDSNVQLKIESSDLKKELSEEKPLPPLVKKFPA